MVKPILVMVPGLDGSGDLFAPLLAEMADGVDCRVLPLPADGEQTATALAARLLPQLPAEPFVLLAESFAGAVAVAIAAHNPPALRALILVATFLQTPRPLLLRLVLRLPRAWFRFGWRLHRPLAALWWPFCGYRADHRTRAAVMQALRQLSWSTLRQRLQALQHLARGATAVPCRVYLVHAGHDRLLPARLRPSLDRLGSPCVVDGPHFLLQSEPRPMAAYVGNCLRAIFPEAGFPETD